MIGTSPYHLCAGCLGRYILTVDGPLCSACREPKPCSVITDDGPLVKGECAATPRDCVVDPRYQDLHAILAEAFAQAAKGKGADRHGNARGYDEQITAALARESGPCGPWFQSGKKIAEAMRLHNRGEKEKARAEALGAIVYAAFGIIAGDSP